MMKKMAADSVAEGKKHVRPAWFIVVRDRMLEFYSDQTTHFINTLALDVIQVLESKNYFPSCSC